MKTVIVYASVHHGNTKKVVDAIAEKFDVDLIDATKVGERDLSGYDAIGFASGIYKSKYHQQLLNFVSVNLPQEKKVFLITTYGSRRNYDKTILAAMHGRNAKIIGRFGCPGYDTFGPFRLIGGLKRGRPNEKDLAAAVEFYRKMKLDQ